MDTWRQWRLYRGDHPSGNSFFHSNLICWHVNIQNDDGEKATVLLGHENKHFKSEQVSFLPRFSLFLQQVSPVNPPKFEKCEDMANLTFLSEAAVFWNLKSRYQANIILSAQSSFWLRPSWSIHTRACSVSLWIHTSGFPSTPTGWRRCTRYVTSMSTATFLDATASQHPNPYQSVTVIYRFSLHWCLLTP